MAFDTAWTEGDGGGNDRKDAALARKEGPPSRTENRACCKLVALPAGLA
jgi:hypothetical protein